MLGEHALAESIECFSFGANERLERFGNLGREGKSIEALSLRVTVTMFKRSHS